MTEAQVDVASLLARIEAERGTITPMTRLLADIDPAFLDLFDRSLRHTVSSKTTDPDALDPRYRDLIVACVSAAIGGPDALTSAHLERAADAGITERQALEALELVWSTVGGAGMIRGVQALLAARERRGDDQSTTT
jgi:alkylhydroperoxidase/carboxymuconolactone decarboxylase family protein YurZ